MTFTRLRRRLALFFGGTWRSRWQRCLTCGEAYGRSSKGRPLEMIFDSRVEPPCGHGSMRDQYWETKALQEHEQRRELARMIAEELRRTT